MRGGQCWGVGQNIMMGAEWGKRVKKKEKKMHQGYSRKESKKKKKCRCQTERAEKGANLEREQKIKIKNKKSKRWVQSWKRRVKKIIARCKAGVGAKKTSGVAMPEREQNGIRGSNARKVAKKGIVGVKMKMEQKKVLWVQSRKGSEKRHCYLI